MKAGAVFDPRAALRSFPKALLVGLAIGAVLKLLGVPSLRSALVVPCAFSIVMWCGFELFGPLLAFVPDERRSAGALAVRASLRGIALYTALLAVAVVLARVLGGVDPVANVPTAIITYLMGFAIMSLVGSFHATGALAAAARASAEHARKTQELEEARALQVSMLPAAAPEVPGFAVAFGMRTATEVGGDYYDWRAGEDGSLRLAVGDATGHGVRAGLLVVAAKTLFQTAVPGALDAEMRRVSDGVRGLKLPRMNMALALATLTPGRLRIAAGGMPPVLHYRAADGSVGEVPVAAPPAGQLARASYREETVELSRGDVLLFLTDGLPELRDEAGELLGYERVRAAFEAAAPRGAQASVDALFAAADAFRGSRAPDDDVTLVAVAVV